MRDRPRCTVNLGKETLLGAHAQTGEGPEHKPMFETKDQNPGVGGGGEPILKGEFPETSPLAWGEAHHLHSHLPRVGKCGLTWQPSPSRLHPFKMAEGRTDVVSRRRGSRSQKGELVTEDDTGHRTDTHTHWAQRLPSGKPERQISKKTNKKRQNKKRNKKTKTTRRYVDKQVGVDFTGSRVTPFVEEPLSETRVPGAGSARATCSPAPGFQGRQGACFLSTPAERAEGRRKGRLPALASLLLPPAPP